MARKQWWAGGRLGEGHGTDTASKPYTFLRRLRASTFEALRTQAEKASAWAVEVKNILGYSSTHVFLDVICEDATGRAADQEGEGATCPQCESTNVLFYRRQSYNESSTWCEEEHGVPITMNC